MTTPERIHHWQHTQLSIARFYGGITYNGAHYRIAVNEPGMPLVRADVLAREAREARKARRADDAAQGGAVSVTVSLLTIEQVGENGYINQRLAKPLQDQRRGVSN